MAIHIIPILKTIAPLVVRASGLVANMKSTAASADTQEKIVALERKAIEAGELLAATTVQLEALAKQVSAQVEENERLERRIRRAQGLGGVALALGLGLVLVLIFWK